MGSYVVKSDGLYLTVLRGAVTGYGVQREAARFSHKYRALSAVQTMRCAAVVVRLVPKKPVQPEITKKKEDK